MWKDLNLRGPLQTLGKVSKSLRTQVCAAGQLALSGIAQSLSRSLWWKAASVATAMAISDFIWARYISSVASAAAFSAATYGVLVVVLGAYIVVSYVEDRRMIAPAALGAWIGTYLAV